MATAFCPHCRAVRNMSVAISRRKAPGKDGKPTEIETRSFHCETCHFFVRSEDRELATGE
ncbi:MAG: hypothetical protein HOC74_09590 [Gemmatimonadetes bacterium]|jgi:hypothetical protein|nr:hypothetical protein [Gemmatimonadota bacterium]